MERSESIAVLAKVVGIWPRQPSDETVAAAWYECLCRVSLGSAIEAVNDYRDDGHTEPPTCGQIYQTAKASDDRIEANRRRAQKKIDGPKRSPEEIAEARKMIRELSEKWRAGKTP